MSFALLALAMASSGHAANDVPPGRHCDTLLPPAIVTGPSRQIAASDLVGLRETGWADGYPGAPSPLSMSPDGKTLAVVLRRGDPARNRHCVGLVLLPLAGGRPTLLDAGDTLLRDRAPWMGIADQPSGRPLYNRPRWSPDGRALFYLRAVEGLAQVWHVDRATGRARPATAAASDVIDFGLTADGGAIVYSCRCWLARARQALSREGLRGWVYDLRFPTLLAAAPSPLAEPAELHALDLVTGKERSVRDDDRSLGVSLGEISEALELPKPAAPYQVSYKLKVADRPFGGSRLRIVRGGVEVRCPDSVCEGPIWDWWAQGGDLYVLRAPPADSMGREEVLRWRPGKAARSIWIGQGVLAGCVPDRASVICMYEEATMPLRIVRLSLESGRLETLLDLNPEFQNLRLGLVERLAWRDANGIQAYGDLMLPPDHRLGDQHPLIVVQYESRGFLRGGSGNEFPVPLFAGHGYAVLSINQPRRAIAARGAQATTIDAFQAAMYAGLWQRRALLASLDAGIDAVLGLGLADPARIGLTGMSDGAATACFALINHPRYAAASLGPGCPDPVTFTALAGPAFADSVARWGLPPADTGQDVWRSLSVARNADRIRIPILIQTGDAELRVAQESFEALRRRCRPIEMIVYPDEYHNKWQPAHLETMYETDVAWFDYWLRDRRPASTDQAARWDQLARRAASDEDKGEKPCQ